MAVTGDGFAPFAPGDGEDGAIHIYTVDDVAMEFAESEDSHRFALVYLLFTLFDEKGKRQEGEESWFRDGGDECGAVEESG